MTCLLEPKPCFLLGPDDDKACVAEPANCLLRIGGHVGYREVLRVERQRTHGADIVCEILAVEGSHYRNLGTSFGKAKRKKTAFGMISGYHERDVVQGFPEQSYNLILYSVNPNLAIEITKQKAFPNLCA